MIRKLTLSNRYAQSYDLLNGSNIFAYDLTGLGLSISHEFLTDGINYKRIGLAPAQGQISFRILCDPYGDSNGYKAYKQFVDFLAQAPYTLRYITDAGTYYRDMVLGDITKSEAGAYGKIDEDITLICTTPWYRNIEVSNKAAEMSKNGVRSKTYIQGDSDAIYNLVTNPALSSMSYVTYGFTVDGDLPPIGGLDEMLKISEITIDQVSRSIAVNPVQGVTELWIHLAQSKRQSAAKMVSFYIRPQGGVADIALDVADSAGRPYYDEIISAKYNGNPMPRAEKPKHQGGALPVHYIPAAAISGDWIYVQMVVDTRGIAGDLSLRVPPACPVYITHPIISPLASNDDNRGVGYTYDYYYDAYGIDGQPASYEVYNNSQFVAAGGGTPCVIEISGPVVNPSWELISEHGNQSDKYFLTLAEGEKLVVSSVLSEMSAIYYDVDRMPHNVYQLQDLTKSNFIRIPPGTSQLSFNDDIETIVKLTYREEYLVV
jgi:hypothetical protein